jgi:enamine deaminase RidA (YjgF/YER057c/UK114 family)
MAAYKRNPGLGGVRTSFRPAAPAYKSNPSLGGALTSFRPRPAAPAATAPVAPGAAPATAAAAAPPPPAAPDPRDSTFNSGVNGLLFNNKNQRADLTHQGEQATTDFNTMLARLAENRANDLLAQNYAANKQGLFYSGQLGKRRDTVDKGYTQQQTDAQTAYDRANAARQTALDRLGEFTADPNSPTGYSGTGQAGLDLSDLLSQAVGRQAGRDANGGGDLAAAAQLGSPDAAAAAGAPDLPAPTATSSGPQPTTGGVAIKIAPSAAHGGAKWVYHRAASGQWIPIRPA